jgi:hypothetical protein
VRKVCAWCGTELKSVEPTGAQGPDGTGDAGSASSSAGSTPAYEGEVDASICRACADRLASYQGPVLVVSREWARLYSEVAEILKARPDIRIVVDRRQPPGQAEGDTYQGPERRRPNPPLTIK